ncbi:MAG: hypothetical protein ACE5PV_20680 [Candidatus Poribacteria bacterium]
MPLYDLTRLQFPGDDSIYHHFHASWLISIADALNQSFPEESGFEAIFEKKVTPIEADIVTIDTLEAELSSRIPKIFDSPKLPPPAVSFVNPIFPEEAKDITIRTASGKIISVIELTSPGNKDAPGKVSNYTANAISYLRRGLNYLIIDVLPPTNFIDTFHNPIAELLDGEPLHPPKEKPFYAISYRVLLAYDLIIETYPTWFGLGETLPTVPLFLIDELRVGIDLETTFMEAFKRLPPRHRRRLRGKS